MLTAALLALFATSAWGMPEPKIVGAKDAPDGFFPYMVSLKNGDEHWCGGTIITANAILTSSTCCTFNNPNFVIFAGSQKIDGNGQTIAMGEKIIHEGFSEVESGGRLNDICIIKPKTPLEFSQTVRQIALPARDLVIPTGRYAMFAGWGSQVFGGVKENNLKVIPNYQILEPTGTSYTVQANEKICSGDFGGPVIYSGIQVGISSWYEGECKGQKPDQATNVALFIPWIEATLGSDKSNLVYGTVL